MMGFFSKKPERPLRVSIWNDPYPYKKTFVVQGFDDLAEQGLLSLHLEPYEFFKKHGAPEIEGPPYRSHKNIVLLLIEDGARVRKVVYDANDIYYKIPNRLLEWSDLYFKSGYQESYLRTGELLTGDFWNSLEFRSECLPEKLDPCHFPKFRPASFSMELYPSLRKNRRFFGKWSGSWLKSPPDRKKNDIFFLGRFWGDTKLMTAAMLQEVRRNNLSLAGGLADSGEILPEELRPFRHRTVNYDRWSALAAQARLGLMTRGLMGCVSFKSLNFLMLGCPFVAAAFHSNFHEPLLPGRNFLQVRDDFADLGDVIRATTSEQLTEMGRANLALWENHISPAATARYMLREASVEMPTPG